MQARSYDGRSGHKVWRCVGMDAGIGVGASLLAMDWGNGGAQGSRASTLLRRKVRTQGPTYDGDGSGVGASLLAMDWGRTALRRDRVQARSYDGRCGYEVRPSDGGNEGIGCRSELARDSGAGGTALHRDRVQARSYDGRYRNEVRPSDGGNEGIGCRSELARDGLGERRRAGIACKHAPTTDGTEPRSDPATETVRV